MRFLLPPGGLTCDTVRLSRPNANPSVISLAEVEVVQIAPITPVNRAIYGTATQSTLTSWAASHAIEGNTDSYANNTSVSHSSVNGAAGNDYWEVSLLRRQYNEVRLWPTTHLGPTVGLPYVRPFDGATAIETHLINNMSIAAPTVVTLTDVHVDRVRVFRNSFCSPIMLAEVEVRGSISGRRTGVAISFRGGDPDAVVVGVRSPPNNHVAPASAGDRSPEMQLMRRLSVFAAACTAALFLAAAPATAQSIFSIGAGSYLAQNQLDTLSFHYFVNQSASGQVHGFLLFSGPATSQLVDITSVMTLPNGAVAFAGTVVWILGTPPGGATVGRGAFMAFEDNGPNSSDRTAGYSLVPLAFPQNATIQQIVGAIGPPTAAQWRALESGGVWIR